MKRPTKVQIEEDTVSIEWDAKLGRLAEGYGKGGDHTPGKGIRISKGLTKRAEQVTLLHELLHEIWIKSDLRDRYAMSTEEFILSALDSWLATLLRQNPDLVAFLAEGDQ